MSPFDAELFLGIPDTANRLTNTNDNMINVSMEVSLLKALIQCE